MSQTSSKTGDYLSVLIGAWPLLAAAFAVALLRGWTVVKRSYLQEHFWQTVLNIFISSAFMAVMAVGIALLAPLAGIDLDPELEVGVVTLLSGMGMKTVDAWIRKKAGFTITEGDDAKTHD